jgi:hypothetical protein
VTCRLEPTWARENYNGFATAISAWLPYASAPDNRRFLGSAKSKGPSNHKWARISYEGCEGGRRWEEFTCQDHKDLKADHHTLPDLWKMEGANELFCNIMTWYNKSIVENFFHETDEKNFTSRLSTFYLGGPDQFNCRMNSLGSCHAPVDCEKASVNKWPAASLILTSLANLNDVRMKPGRSLSGLKLRQWGVDVYC